MVKTNYQKKTEEILSLADEKSKKPTLLLQSCCGPCSSYVLSYLAPHFKVFLYYYNPNIYPMQEYEKRLETQKRLLALAPFAADVTLVEGEYDHDRFLEAVKGKECLPEGGDRCADCFSLRLEETAAAAARMGADYFGTTLTVSPHKNAEVINKLGESLQNKYGVKFLFSDFKKKEGYKHSIELSAEYGLYRQHYCGCEFSVPKE